MQNISEFQLTEEVFSEGKTRICRAVQRADGRLVVLKILSSEQIQSDDFVEYHREYELTASLKGIAGVIKVSGMGNIQNSIMIVEEDIGGDSLAKVLAKGNIGLAQALSLAIRIADTLGQIHQHHVIHKDLNPANIVWNQATDELRIIDFGIASQLSQERHDFQSINRLEGSLAYISPEQTGRVNRQLDYRSDLYSLGVSLYQMFTGILPFAGREGIELVHAHIALPPVPPHKINQDLPPVVSQIVMRLMEKMADDRYQSAHGLQHDLQRCLSQLQKTGHVASFPLGSKDASIRFQIPQKLYGRDAEISTIMAAFGRVAAGGCELLLVRGLPGTGKSALVNEVHKPLTESHGSFIAGKFDQYQHDVPFYAWTLAFEEFCNWLLKEDDASLAIWRGKILEAVGAIGKVLTDVIPSIESIIGKQPEVPPLAGEQALNRLNYVFGKFLKTICQPEHPLVVFIDDWQWADAGSVSLLKSVAGNHSIQHLLLICAYRNNEVHGAHPFALACEEIRKNGANVGAIDLADLGQNDVRCLVNDALKDSPELETFSRLVYEKTHGNAFFLIQLLNDLYEKAVITFSPELQHWVWREHEVESREVADNVVDLMGEKIRRLPESLQHCLVHAACIGDRFDLFTLATILGTPSHEVARHLDVALREGILLPIGLNYRVAMQADNTRNAHYQFIHDRVRQAAYSMLGASAAEKIHYDIANIWLSEYSSAEQEQHIFDIANQFNAGRGLIRDDKQKAVLFRINILAGKRAKNATAYSTAQLYFQAALTLQDADCWQTMAEQSAELYLLAAEVAFLGKDYAAMESWLDEFLGHVDAPLECVKAFKVRLQAYVAQNRLSEAVDVALHTLGLLGIDLPKSPSEHQVVDELTQTLSVLKDKSLDQLRALPKMTDPVKLAAMDILGLTIPPAYWTSQELVALTVFHMVRESVAHGYSPNAGYGYSWWGITECAMLGNIDSGYAFGEFAIELAKQHDLNLQQPMFFAAWIIRKFKRPLSECIPLFEQTYALSLEIGDFEYASYARNNYIQALFHTGRNLGSLLSEMKLAHHDLQRFQIGSSLYWHGIWWQVALNFVNATQQPDILDGPAYDETVSLPQHLKVNDISSLFLLYLAKLMLSCFFNDKESALAYAEKARTYLKGGIGMHAFVLFHFYESLTLLANQDRVGKRRVARQVAENQEKLQKWSGSAPMNYGHHWTLIEAERLRASNKSDQALKQYELAIDQAQENGFIHEEALAMELTARCYTGRGQERLATYYIKESLQLYERWGAHAKVVQLKAEFSSLLLMAGLPVGPLHSQQTMIGKVSLNKTSSTQKHSDAFDLSAITGASQAISSEIVIDKLITTLLKIVIEHSGAQKALLILTNGAELSIQAQGIAAQTIGVSLNSLPIKEQDDLPLPRSIIQYVRRTLKSLVISDAREETQFSRDPYIAREKPLSILCEPIVQQGKLMGILYLENNLTAGAFAEERLELLRLLSSQAAISIENANLYHQLEQKVEERTQKLQAALATQEHLNNELQMSSQQLEQAHTRLHEANRLLQQQADTDGLTGLANRRSFNERLRYELDRCARERQPLSLIMCDLDNFKLYNDTYGHVEGDECPRRAANALQSTFSRSTDMVARYGGEEFVALLPQTSVEQSASMGEMMRAAISALKIPHSKNAQYGIATISVGCHSLVPDADTSLEAVISQADKALYQAKDRGRNCFVQIS